MSAIEIPDSLDWRAVGARPIPAPSWALLRIVTDTLLGDGLGSMLCSSGANPIPPLTASHDPHHSHRRRNRRF